MGNGRIWTAAAMLTAIGLLLCAPLHAQNTGKTGPAWTPHSLRGSIRGRRRYDINVDAGELAVRPPGAPTTPGRGAQRR
jgi:hypothetical protein